LATLRASGAISEWHDRRIAPGEDWDKEISHYLDKADVILLLLSADFLASGYCRGKEMKRAIERLEAGQAKVIPIMLRAVDWHGEAISKLQALPTDAKPVTSWPNKDEAWTDVAAGIRRAVTELAQGKQEPAVHDKTSFSSRLSSDAWKEALMDLAEYLKTYSACWRVPPGTTEGSTMVGVKPGDDWEDRFYIRGIDFEGLNQRIGLVLANIKACGMRPSLKPEEPPKAIHHAYDLVSELAGELRKAWAIRRQLRLPRPPHEFAAAFQAAIDDPLGAIPS
jgi:hypothetical protein